mmetsp:Transcript_134509/g.251677  ORF Transcript_134509/g.251677 Transcript_134509/m.251677 type:complete len:389 (+) Transcript_134509:169-1335(+)
MQVEFDALGKVEYVTGPKFPSGPHWEKKAYDPPIDGRYVLDTEEESDDQVVLKYLGDNRFEWAPRRQWVHSRGAPWIVTATVDPCVYRVSADCPHYWSGYQSMRVEFDKDGDVQHLEGPKGARWIRWVDRPKPSDEVEPAAEPEPAAEEPPKPRPSKIKILEEPEEKPRPSLPDPAPWKQDVVPKRKPRPSRLPRIRSGEGLSSDELAELHARRACKLAYHRSVAPPPVYQVYRRTAMAEDLKAADASPITHVSHPNFQEKKFQNQRKAYTFVPKGTKQFLKSQRGPLKERTLEPIAEAESSGEMSFKSTGGERKLPHIQSAPVLGSAGKASLGTSPYGVKTLRDMKAQTGTLKLLRKYNAQRSDVEGLDMLRFLKEGRLPSILCPPI